METTLTQPRFASVAFFGDIRLTGPRQAGLLDPAVRDFSDAHALRCCNFEGAVPHEGAVIEKTAGPAVMQGPDAAARVLDAGFNLITLANNHMMDYGAPGLDATVRALSAAALLGAGDTPPMGYRPYIVTVNGVKLGFLACSEKQHGVLDGSRQAGVAWICHPRMMNDIRYLRAECDHVIVLPHAGLEDVTQPLPEWRALYRRFIDAGASAVIGSHPHAPQGYERYKRGIIVYSLGNAAWEPEEEFAERCSLLASVRFPAGGEPELTVRPLVFSAGHIRFDDSPGTAARMDEINRVLMDDTAYHTAVAEMTEAFYRQVALPDFFTVTGALPGNGWQRTKNAAKLLLRKPALNESLLLHMLENESYRWAVCSFLSREREEPKES